jgi:hypothetical protein
MTTRSPLLFLAFPFELSIGTTPSRFHTLAEEAAEGPLEARSSTSPVMHNIVSAFTNDGGNYFACEALVIT